MAYRANTGNCCGVGISALSFYAGADGARDGAKTPLAPADEVVLRCRITCMARLLARQYPAGQLFLRPLRDAVAALRLPVKTYC